jgi:hypothetical protein
VAASVPVRRTAERNRGLFSSPAMPAVRRYSSR